MVQKRVGGGRRGGDGGNHWRNRGGGANGEKGKGRDMRKRGSNRKGFSVFAKSCKKKPGKENVPYNIYFVLFYIKFCCMWYVNMEQYFSNVKVLLAACLRHLLPVVGDLKVLPVRDIQMAEEPFVQLSQGLFLLHCGRTECSRQVCWLQQNKMLACLQKSLAHLFSPAPAQL